MGAVIMVLPGASWREREREREREALGDGS